MVPLPLPATATPLIGPVPGIRNYFAACGVMAAFSQGGGVGLSLAQWIVDGEPETNTLAMDISRYGDWAKQAFVTEKVKENYGRRFQITYPNEELMAGRPLRVQSVHGEFVSAGAVFTQVFGLECPAWFAGSPEKAHEEPSFYHSDAHPYIGAEARAVRAGAGLSEIAIYGKHLWRGPEALNTLSRLLAGRIPGVGRVSLTPMLSPQGRMIGDFTIARLGEDEFFMVGSRAAQEYHRRWFLQHMPPTGLDYAPLSDDISGFLISGPQSRALLQTADAARFEQRVLSVFFVHPYGGGGDCGLVSCVCRSRASWAMRSMWRSRRCRVCLRPCAAYRRWTRAWRVCARY